MNNGAWLPLVEVSCVVACAASLLGPLARSQGPLDDLARGVIGPGDFVRVMMREDPDVKYEGIVSTSGRIFIPVLGEFRIAGMTQDQAAEELEKALVKTFYKRASVTATLVQKGPGKVYVYGAVKTPGVVDLPGTGRFTVLHLISEVGGLTSWAVPEDAYVVRPSEQGTGGTKIPVNLAEMFSQSIPQLDSDTAADAVVEELMKTSQSDIQLRANDIIFVPGVNSDPQQFI